MSVPKLRYRGRALASNVALGAIDGIDGAVWGYAFASIIFSGALAIYLPAGVFLILCGWALVAATVTVSSRLSVHIAELDEQAIVIIGSISVLLGSHLGADVASSKGLSTMLAVMSLSSLGVAASFYLAARFHMARFLELLPYPVICGFMAGIGWLLLDAGFSVAVNEQLSIDVWRLLSMDDNAVKLLLPLLCGIGLLVLVNRIDKAWALPVGSLSIFAAFYGVSTLFGFDHQSLTERGWLFDLAGGGDAMSMLAGFRFSAIDVSFLISVIPQLFTIVFLSLLGASMNITTLIATHPAMQLSAATEMRNQSGANVLAACIGSPPGYSDAVSTEVYDKLGASSRWMQLTSVLIMLLVAFFGSSLINYMPRVLVAAMIFLFAFQIIHDWMYSNLRSCSPLDYAIVCVILVTVIFFGFMLGIFIGIILTTLLFVMRYSMITAIQGTYSLGDYRSSVERSAASNQILNQHGGEVLVYSLQGFLFFGTANTIRDALRENVNSGRYHSILLDLRRVTGIDISALNSFSQIKRVCEIEGVQLAYANIAQETQSALVDLEAVSVDPDGKYMLFADTDIALERLEEILLQRYGEASSAQSVASHLTHILSSKEKSALLESLMVKTQIAAGETLFKQGDEDNGFYMLESGLMTAMIELGQGRRQRVKKFSPGAIIGEMSSYTSARLRTATIIADEDSILYHLDTAALRQPSASNFAAQAAVHELVARTLGFRVEYMNRRLMLELK